jgi:hypothetical protein
MIIRKIMAIMLCTFFVLLIESGHAQDKAIKKGFSINLITGFPSPENYGFPGLDPNLENKGFFGLEIGNRWYFNQSKKLGIGMGINWFDLTMQMTQIDPPYEEGDNERTYVFNASLFEIGPIGTLALTSNIGLDAYYNIRPTYIKTGIYLDNEEELGRNYDTGDQLGFGFSHTFGGSLRLKSFALSFEYLLGNIRTVDSKLEELDNDMTGNEDALDISDHLSLNHFRIMIGFKF